MNSKLIAACGGAFGAGAVLAWAFTADRWERKLLETVEMSSRIISRQEGHIRELNAENHRLSTPADWDLNDAAIVFETPVDVETDEDVIPPGETPVETENKLKNMIAQYSSDPDVQEEFISMAHAVDRDSETAPFVITQRLYAWDEDEGDNYAKVTLTYYPKDQLLVDEDESVIENPNEVVGTDYVRRFGDESGDADVVFVRNRRLNADFEVIRDTENDIPIHLRYGMSKEEFAVERAAGNIVLKEDRT